MMTHGFARTTKKNWLRGLGLVLGSIVLAIMPNVSRAEVVQPAKNGIALGGYDVVSYFEEKKPNRGSARFSSRYKKLTYHFKNAKYKALFESKPESYIPSYGGYCSLGMKFGQKSPVDLDTWRIYKGRLYLLYNSGTAAVWDRAVKKNVRTADRVWAQLH